MPADDADPRFSFQRAEGDSLSAQLNRLAVSLLTFSEDRLDLLRWEAAHELSRVSSMLVRGFCAALLGFFTLEVLALLLVAIFWDTAWRLQAIAAVMLAAVLGTVLLVVAYLRMRNGQSGLSQPSSQGHHDAVGFRRP